MAVTGGTGRPGLFAFADSPIRQGFASNTPTDFIWQSVAAKNTIPIDASNVFFSLVPGNLYSLRASFQALFASDQGPLSMTFRDASNALLGGSPGLLLAVDTLNLNSSKSSVELFLDMTSATEAIQVKVLADPTGGPISASGTISITSLI